MGTEFNPDQRGDGREVNNATAFSFAGRAMKKIQHVPRRQTLMGSKWAQHVYGKRQRAFDLITRAERLKSVVRLIVAGALIAGVFAVLHD